MQNDTHPFLYRFLPPAVKEFFLERGLEDIKEIAERYGLSQNAVDELDTIQQEILFGYEPLDKLENIIRARLGYDQILARKIIADLLEKRFLPLDSYLEATAFRLYSAVGGNSTVVNVIAVDSAGQTAKQTREKQEEFLRSGKAGNGEKVKLKNLGIEELRNNKTEIIDVVRKFDETLDKAEPIHKGEKPLDPSHEIAPPPPMIVEEKDEARTKLDTLVKADVAETNIVQSLKNTGQKAPSSIENPKIDEVVRKLSLTFASSELQKRFRVLVGARLSGVRKPDDFKTALTRAIAYGGLGFEEKAAERIIEAVEAEMRAKNEVAAQKAHEEKQAFVTMRQEAYGTNKSDETDRTNITSVKPTTVPAEQDNMTKTKTPPSMSEASVVLEKTPSGKTPVMDVVPPRRLSGPIEELAAMTLDDFRRIPGAIQNAISSIADDLGNLAKQDPGLYIRGAAAWRMSPLVSEYRRLLALSLKDGIKVEKVLEDPAKNPQGLKIEEMAALREFHSSLRSSGS